MMVSKNRSSGSRFHQFHAEKISTHTGTVKNLCFRIGTQQRNVDKHSSPIMPLDRSAIIGGCISPVTNVKRHDRSRPARFNWRSHSVPPDVIDINCTANSSPSRSQISSAWRVVFTPAASAAYIGCKRFYGDFWTQQCGHISNVGQGPLDHS